MATRDYITINGTALPISGKADYSVEYEDYAVEGQTEAGTTIRDVVREGIPTVKATLKVTQNWMAQLREFKRQPTLTVEYLDPETGELSEEHIMYISDFSPKRVWDVSYGIVWEVDLVLKDLEDV